ncbi:hypothetical protein J2X48_000923 [Bosea sp. BE271]|uniref:hypothetical protein n=1 Tax=Bosea TaxID=85413 RepID=UPI0028542682|nr:MULTISPECIES: hypothetical protein [Bosea]MDR6827205.1 hypothetical protein [Bosea robiniae]MDR6893915.1 hypothetical protein [Bosea sp. BE109]MDR7137310.1 hypothetical protein [Bosea sp. BE168]MDR7174010.1 hypothetical protein [Bosea sp. BE271]
MTSRVSIFKCDAVTAHAPEVITDDSLGELQIAAAPAEPEPKRTPLIVDDPELGPLVLGPAPAMRALPYRTGPPRGRSSIAGDQ